MYFGGSKEPSHWDGSFEYPQQMFGMRNKKNSFPIHTLIWGPGLQINSLNGCFIDGVYKTQDDLSYIAIKYICKQPEEFKL